MGRTGGTSTCKWCSNKAIPRQGLAQVCERCQDRIDHVIRDAMARQRAGGLTDPTMAREFGITSETWRTIRRKVRNDPSVRVPTSSISPRHVVPTGAPELPVDDPAPRGWERRAACAGVADPDIFFPESPRRDKGRITEAKSWCADCPVRAECRSHHGREGIWGGFLYVVP
jgi:hypothetical protein